MIFLGIVLPALLLAGAVRRWVAPLEWRYVALFLVLTLAFLHGAVFTSRVPVPVDEVARGYPYRGVIGEVTPRNALTNDTVKLFLPWMEVAREELFALRAPLWNRYSFGGYPLLANGESAPFSPLFLTTLFVPLPGQIVAMGGLKIFVALLFAFLCGRRAGLSVASSMFVASAFAFSVFQTVFLYYSTVSVTAFLPAAVYALLQAQEHARRRDVVLVALVVATLLANGHPESVLHIAIGGFVVLAIDLVSCGDKRAWLRRFRAPLCGTLAGLALSAATWVPVLEQVLSSARLAELSASGGHAVTYPLTALWAMVSPNGFGNPVRGNWGWLLNYSLVAASYVGLIVLALFVSVMLARGTSRRDRLQGVAAILLWLIAMGWSPVGRLVNEVPPFSISANDKLRFVALFLAALVAARALERMSAWYFAAATVLAGLATYVYVLRRATMQPVDLVAPMTLLVLAGVMVFARRYVPVAASALLIVDLFTLNTGFNALVESRYYKPRLPIVEELHRIAPQEPVRIAGLEWMFLPNASAHYGLEDVRGSDPMAYAGYVDLLRPVVVDDRSMDFDRLVDVHHPLLNLLNVRYLMTEPGLDPGGRWRSVYAGRDGSLFENLAVWPRFFVREGCGSVHVTQPAAGRFELRVTARTPLRIGSSQWNGAGWSVRGAEKLQGRFVEMLVPAGNKTVEVTYRPLTFWVSLVVGIALALLPLSVVPAGTRSLENKP